jgi:hypothetical protein
MRELMRRHGAHANQNRYQITHDSTSTSSNTNANSNGQPLEASDHFQMNNPYHHDEFVLVILSGEHFDYRVRSSYAVFTGNKLGL